jgi:hypothetical protein
MMEPTGIIGVLLRALGLVGSGRPAQTYQAPGRSPAVQMLRTLPTAQPRKTEERAGVAKPYRPRTTKVDSYEAPT